MVSMLSSKLRRMALAAIALLCLAPAPVRAENWSPSDLSSGWPRFLVGMAGCVAAHESGHALVALSSGYSVGHAGPSLTYQPAFRSRSDQLRVASAGFQTQWLASEIAFATMDKGGNLAAGFVAGHLATSLAYLVVLKNQPRGDTVGMAHASGLSVNQVASILALPALLDGWRLFGRDVPRWVPALSLALKGTEISAAWAF